MKETELNIYDATLIKRTGESKKTGKPYTMYLLRIHHPQYGNLDIVLDTRTDRAGIILSMEGGE